MAKVMSTLGTEQPRIWTGPEYDTVRDYQQAVATLLVEIGKAVADGKIFPPSIITIKWGLDTSGTHRVSADLGYIEPL